MGTCDPDPDSRDLWPGAGHRMGPWRWRRPRRRPCCGHPNPCHSLICGGRPPQPGFHCDQTTACVVDCWQKQGREKRGHRPRPPVRYKGCAWSPACQNLGAHRGQQVGGHQEGSAGTMTISLREKNQAAVWVGARRVVLQCALRPPATSG